MEKTTFGTPIGKDPSFAGCLSGPEAKVEELEATAIVLPGGQRLSFSVTGSTLGVNVRTGDVTASAGLPLA